MTHANDLFAIIIGLNLVFAGVVVTFILGSPKGLAAGKVETDSTRRSRRFTGFSLIVGGVLYALLGVTRIL